MLVGVSRTFTEVCLRRFSIHLTNYHIWFAIKRLKSNRPDEKDCSISSLVYKQAFYHLFVIKTVCNKLNGRGIFILYSIYPNYIDTMLRLSLLVDFISFKGCWTVSGWTWENLCCLEEIFLNPAGGWLCHEFWVPCSYGSLEAAPSFRNTLGITTHLPLSSAWRVSQSIKESKRFSVKHPQKTVYDIDI